MAGKPQQISAKYLDLERLFDGADDYWLENYIQDHAPKSKQNINEWRRGANEVFARHGKRLLPAFGRLEKWLKDKQININALIDKVAGRKGSIDPPRYAVEDMARVRRIDSDISPHGGSITCRSCDIRTVADLIAHTKPDLEKFKITREKVQTWETTISGKKSSTGEDRTVTNYLVAITLEPRNPPAIEIALKGIVEDIKIYRPATLKEMKTKHKNGDRLLEICLFDVHFGLLAWEETGGESWDTDRTERVYLEAVRDILHKAEPFQVGQIVFPIGSDFFHINDGSCQTPRGKKNLDADKHIGRVIRSGVNAVIKAVDYCRKIAPVDVVWVPGNHDMDISYWLTLVLEAAFSPDPAVNVDLSSAWRKCYTYGTTFIGYTHGSEEPVKELPRIFLDEFPREWAGAEYREIHLGHKHRRHEVKYTSAIEIGATMVRELPSLSGTSHWAYKKGYIGAGRYASGFLYHKESGLDGYLLSDRRIIERNA